MNGILQFLVNHLTTTEKKEVKEDIERVFRNCNMRRWGKVNLPMLEMRRKMSVLILRYIKEGAAMEME